MSQQIKIYDTNKIDGMLNGKANSSHTHSISQITDLQNQLNGKLDVNGQAKESVTIISPNGRISTPDYGATNKSRVHAQIDISSTQMTTNKPAGDGYIWTHFWDNGSWAGQLFIPTGEYDTSNCHLQRRGQNNGVWRSWEDIAWKKEVDAKANINHTHSISEITNLQTTLDSKASQADLDAHESTTADTFENIYMRACDLDSIEVTGNQYQFYTLEGSGPVALPFKTINGNNIVGTGNVTISASIPSEVAKIVGSGTSYIDIQRYGSASYRMFIAKGTFSSKAGQTISVSFGNTMPTTNYAIFFTMHVTSGSTTSVTLPSIWSQTTTGFTGYVSVSQTFQYIAVCLV